jgi:uncharacterized damage-inducible protein DinB
MELIDYFRRQFAYDEWANREVIDGAQAASHDTSRAAQLFAHILSAERLWLERICGHQQSFPVWPNFSLDECALQLTEVARLWREYLRSLSPDALQKKITYKNTKGESWSNTVEEILTHVTLHSAYHRGQIAMQMRSNGNEPAYTDFIQAVRTGLIK